MRDGRRQRRCAARPRHRPRGHRGIRAAAPVRPGRSPAAVASLTPREREILDLLARGLSNPRICQQLVISEATAKTHVARILHKLGLRDRIQIVIYAYETGLITPGSTAGHYQAD